MFSSSVSRYSLLPTASSMANAAEESLLDSSHSVIRVVEPNNKLSTFFGVVVPVILSMFSVILFLRLGFVVGQAGVVLAFGMLVTAYFVVGLTVLSISAIATNGTVKGGGAYYMISRTLGPEFGGSIGVIFYFANIFASALYILGFVEAFLNSFPQISDLFHHHPSLYHFLCGSVVLLLCLGVCLIGAGMFAKTSFIIFVIVMAAMLSSFISFFIMGPKSDYHGGIENLKSDARNGTYNYTSWNIKTFRSNLWCKFGVDYTTQDKQNTLTVFGVLFTGVTGIMAGANISGDLKNPGYAIPFGTLAASIFTFIIYVLLIFFTGATCSRGLLQNNYNYIQVINKVQALVTAGAFAVTLSASLSCLIGASRILQALAQDDLLVILRPFAKLTARRREPLRAVLVSWLFIQAIIAIGKVNAVAGIVSMFFLLSYGVTNMACFALKAASAPNFRPTFQYFSWQTALLGALLCFTIMFLINPMYAAIAVAVMVILFVLISLRAPPTPWGDVSQALIYHQVRKYLLRLDLRKHHVKFWRPQVLLLVSNPRSSYPLIDFVNDIKKSGLYILGHVQVDEFNARSLSSQEVQLSTWLNFVDCTELKAFVDLIVAPSIRIGAQNLLMTSGLGGMKPNTLILGFFDYELPEEQFSRGILRRPRFSWMRGQRKDELYRQVQEDLAMLRAHPGDQTMTLKDYVGIIKDAVVMGKNVCIARNFSQLDKNTLGREGNIDVWPVNSTAMTGLVFGSYDYTFLLILQLSCVLHMVPFWECRTKLRVMQIVETINEDSHREQEQSLSRLLKGLRIPAEVRMVHVTDEVQFQTRNADGMAPSTNWYRTVNQLMRIHSGDAYVVFTGLPSPPVEENMAQQFIQDITILSDHLPPIMMVYGNSPVVTTSL